MTYERRDRPMYRQRPPYGGRGREGIERDRSRLPPRDMIPHRGRTDPRRPPFPRRGTITVEEPTLSLMERILSPGISSKITVYSGVVSLSIAVLYILLKSMFDGDLLSLLMVPPYFLGWLCVLSAVAFAVVVLVKGDEEQHNASYLGMGLAVGSVILLVSGAILFPL
ncbi:MAG: hypothetical protein QCI82_08740 [Candidatus Thermoplasmatota archaeon]|nr:hypothetical protein [Candidatus Thermoplasmatota archaeon]